MENDMRLQGGMSTRERVLELKRGEVRVTDIARLCKISRQRVHQILKSPEHKPRGRKKMLSEEQKEQAKKIILKKKEWTWLTAEEALHDAIGRVPAMWIYDLLRELGYEKSSHNSPVYRR